MMLPPTVAAGETLEVQVLDGAITEMWMNEVFKEMNINGYLKLVSANNSYPSHNFYFPVLERSSSSLEPGRVEN